MTAKVFAPFATQSAFANFWGQREQVLNFSGCGTGKTLACIHSVKTYWPGARVLVLAPLSILKPAWGEDLDFGWPETTYAIASGTAAKKRKAFESGAQWVITNHDTIKHIMKEGIHIGFDVLIVDEADAFRNRTSQRSKALNTVARHFQIKNLMTGTPTPRSITDVWHLANIVDHGERLGRNFFEFRSHVCTPKPIPGVKNAMDWVDKPDAQDTVTAMLSDITFRVSLEDVTELPETVFRDITVDLPAKLRCEYEEMRKESLMMLNSGEVITAVHAGARFQKLLQILSGAIYDENGEAQDLHPERHKLVLDLVEENDHSLVAFNWKHQKEGLIAEAKKRKLNYQYIDGSVSMNKRAQIVKDFQAGKYQVLFLHPQSAGHGLTLTRANRLIWASPIYRADLYEQLNHRIVRNGQKRKTEIIHIAADCTIEQEVYQKLMGKKVRMDDLLSTIIQLQTAA